jgi:phosphoglycolate phosphatase-like HAD superfamily hydrolase
VKRLKPDPEGILLAVKQLGGNSFFMVGDLALDILAAKSANGRAILLRRPDQSGFQDLFKSLPAEVVEKAQGFLDEKDNLRADYIIPRLTEVPAIVQREKNKTQTSAHAC